MANVSVLEVLLYDKPIGTLTRVGDDRTLFAFNDDYINDRNRPVLGLGFKDQFGELITEHRTPSDAYQTHSIFFKFAAGRAYALLSSGAEIRKGQCA